MPDMTVVWKDAVPFEAAFGQQQTGAEAKGVQADAAAMAKGFDVKPVYDSSVMLAWQGAVPYVSDSVVEVVEDVVDDVVSKRPVGRPKKEV